MRPYYEHGGITIYHGDCREVLPNLSVAAVVADPPYGMGKADWDHMLPVESWLPSARTLGPVALFCGIRGVHDYPKPDWIGAWVRLGSTQRNGGLSGFNNWEPILFYGITSLSNDVISMPNTGYQEVNGHPTVKPLGLIKALLARMPDGTVLDPFMGSGTSLRAAKDVGRCAIGIDTNERYCEIAAKRLSQEVLPLEMPA